MRTLDSVLGMMLATEPRTAVEPRDETAIVRLASAHLVLPALRAGAEGKVSHELLSFLASVEAANALRNRRLRQALVAVTRALNAHGIEPVVLKGGVHLATGEDAAPWRFLGDFDLLVDPDALPEAVEAARAAGFAPAHDDYDPSRDAHYPVLASADGTASIELHTRLFARDAGLAIDAALPRRSMPHTIEGARLRIPAPALRLAHLLAHSQLHHGFHPRHRILLRDVLDIARLAPDRGIIEDALACLGTEAGRMAARRLLLAAGRLTGQLPRIPDAAPADHRWADRAIGRLGRDGLGRKLAVIGDDLGAGLSRAMTEPGRAGRLARLVLDPRGLARRLRKRGAKLRQALWA